MSYFVNQFCTRIYICDEKFDRIKNTVTDKAMERCRFRIYNYIFINTNVNAGNKVTYFLDFALMWKFVINEFS